HPQQRELPVSPGQAAPRGHEAPDRNAHRDDDPAAPRVGQAAERDAEERVEAGEAEAHEEAHLRVADAEVTLDRGDQQVQDLAVDEGEDVGRREDTDDVPGVEGWRVDPSLLRGQGVMHDRCARSTRFTLHRPPLRAMRSDLATDPGPEGPDTRAAP